MLSIAMKKNRIKNFNHSFSLVVIGREDNRKNHFDIFGNRFGHDIIAVDSEDKEDMNKPLFQLK